MRFHPELRVLCVAASLCAFTSTRAAAAQVVAEDAGPAGGADAGVADAGPAAPGTAGASLVGVDGAPGAIGLRTPPP